MNGFDKETYKLKANILKAMVHPIRLAIVDLLADGERTVGEISGYVESTQSNVSKQLAVLKHSGIIDDRKVGLNCYYYLKLPCAKQFSTCVIKTLKARTKHMTGIS